MKKLVIAAIFSALTIGAYAQGVVAINTANANAYVKYSNTVANAFCAGNAYYAGLYWATDAATLQSGGGTLVTTGGTNSGLAIFLSGAASGYVGGTSFGGNRAISERAGQTTYFQLRAWSSGFATYADALASGDGSKYVSVLTGVGASPVVSSIPTATSSSPVSNIAWAPGSASNNPLVVQLIPVPEPSVIALGVLGLAGALFIRRRK